MDRFNCLLCAEIMVLSDRFFEGIEFSPILLEFDIYKEINGFVSAESKWIAKTDTMCASGDGDVMNPDFCDVDEDVQAAIKLGFEYEDIVCDVDWHELKRRNTDGTL